MLKNYFRLMTAFGLFMFYYLVVELLIPDRARSLLVGANLVTLYGSVCFAASAGFVMFAPLGRICITAPARCNALYFVTAVNALCAASLALVKNPSFFVLLSVITALTAGYIGAAALYAFAVCVREKHLMGRLITIPYASAFLAQFVLDSAAPKFGGFSPYVHFAAIIPAIIICAALLSGCLRKASAEARPQKMASGDVKKYLAESVIACLIVCSLYSMIDAVIMTLFAGKQLDVNGYVRLLASPSVLAVGWLADFKDDTRFFSFSTLCAMIAALVSVALFGDLSTYNGALGSLYVFAAFMTGYSVIIFVKAALMSDCPEFWASAGRAVKYAVGGIFTLAGSFIFTHMRYSAILIVYTALLLALVAIFYAQGRLSVVANEPKKLTEHTDAAAGTYGFTSRELDVLGCLSVGKTTAEIAAEMSISERTVNFHIGSMLKKTGARSRVELISKLLGVSWKQKN